MVHRIFLFAHVLAAFLYLLAHGGSAAVAFRVRRETNAERVRALLDLSRSSVAVANYMFLATVVCGVALGFLGHFWSTGWIWLSIVVLVVVLAVMGRAAGPYFRRIRGAVGLVFADGRWQHAGRESSAEELALALKSGSAGAVTALSMGGWAVILWLMLFKPF
ncbi:MAG TPA: hypothetical protein VFI52_04125 [Gemmatimonadaceae bacterium]|nr:hypothetical protein [Gemmatimonadaceae bacterium]